MEEEVVLVKVLLTVQAPLINSLKVIVTAPLRSLNEYFAPLPCNKQRHDPMKVP